MDDEDQPHVLNVTINVMGPDGMTQVIIPIPEQHHHNDCREAYAEGVGDGVIALLKVMQPDATWAREGLKYDG